MIDCSICLVEINHNISFQRHRQFAFLGLKKAGFGAESAHFTMKLTGIDGACFSTISWAGENGKKTRSAGHSLPSSGSLELHLVRAGNQKVFVPPPDDDRRLFLVVDFLHRRIVFLPQVGGQLLKIDLGYRHSASRWRIADHDPVRICFFHPDIFINASRGCDDINGGNRLCWRA